MRTVRVLALVALLAALAALAVGCSKPVAPNAAAVAGTSVMDRARAARDPIPSPYIVRLKFVGPVVALNSAFQPVLDKNAEFFVYSTGEAPPVTGTGGVVDTVPAYGELKQVLWRTAASGTGAAAAAHSADVFEAAPVFVGGAAGGPAPTFSPGLNIVRLQAPERAGGGTVTVAFYMDFPPGSWWAGPDPALFPPSSDGDGRAVDVTDWAHFTTTPAWPPDGRGYFGPDSFRVVPSQRRPVRGDFDRRTFYEIFGDRIYARAEGDTVHQNSWVVLVHAGFDRDSKYLPIVNPADPGLPAGYASSPDLYSVLIPQAMIGSPSAFRSGVWFRLPNGSLMFTSMSSPYPNFDPFSVFRYARVAGYWRMSWPGKAYAVVHAVDGEGITPYFFDEMGIADHVDAGGGTPEERLQRRQILTFYVRPAP